MYDFKRILMECRNIAVIGISDKPDRDSGRIAVRLQQAGYHVTGVHPVLAEVFDIPVYPNITDIPGTIDLIDIFLSGDKLPQLVEEILKVRPKVVWFQLGVHNQEVQKILEDAGIEVIVDHCIAIELRSVQHGG